MSFIAILAAAVLQFIIGGLWYSVLFGKTWMKIMHEERSLSADEMKSMQKQMMPFYALQFVLALLTTWVLANNLAYSGIIHQVVPSLFYAFFMWLGYIMPIEVSSVIWGNTKRKYWIRQIAIMAGMQLIGILAAAVVLAYL